jgi:hypothetical protein
VSELSQSSPLGPTLEDALEQGQGSWQGQGTNKKEEGCGMCAEQGSRRWGAYQNWYFAAWSQIGRVLAGAWVMTTSVSGIARSQGAA